MNKTRLVVILVVIGQWIGPRHLSGGETSPFSYQGQLKHGDVPINDTCDMTFTLWSNAEPSPLERSLGTVEFTGLNATQVTNGLFQVSLDFGSALHSSSPRFVEVKVLCPTIGRDFVALTPRQPIRPTPVAQFALDGNPGPAGPPGPAGADGLACWDLNGNGIMDVTEDTNDDGVFDALDCAGDAGGVELVLPFSGTNPNDDIALTIIQQGFFPAGAFIMESLISSQPSLFASHAGPGAAIMGSAVGTGKAGDFRIGFGTSTNTTLHAENNSMGAAGWFVNLNQDNPADALTAVTRGDGSAGLFRSVWAGLSTAPVLKSETNTSGPAARFETLDPQTSANGLELSLVSSGDGINISLAGNENLGSNGVFVEQTNLGSGVRVIQNGAGAGSYFQITPYTNISPAVLAQHDGRGYAGRFVTTAENRARPTVSVESAGDQPGLQSESTGTSDAVFGWSKNTGSAVRGFSEGTGGEAGYFQLVGETNAADAVTIRTDGVGRGLRVNVEGAVNTSPAVQVNNEGLGNGMFIQSTNTSNTNPALWLDHLGSGHALFAHTWGNNHVIRALANFQGDAVNATVDGGTGNAGSFIVANGNNTQAAVFARTNGTGAAGYFENTNTSTPGLAAIHAVSQTPTSGYAGYFQGRGYFSSRLGIGVEQPQHALDVNGRVRTHELEITAGADLAEQFDITPGDVDVTPGLVVSIDPQNPGKLRPSTTPYDRTVAGVVSGAGGVRPGMLMGQTGTLANGSHPVALTGRVYTLCDAASGPIKPGDLLTTSPRTGHAMKATNPSRASGATIGKAMTGLDEGCGLVLVLVNLQ